MPTKKTDMMTDTGMIMTWSFGLTFLANLAVIYLANMFLPMQVVLGTHSITPLWGMLLGAGILALFTVLLVPFFHLFEMKRGKMLSSMEWMAAYLVIDFVGVWLISRAAETLGLGVASWMVALGLAIVLDFVQGIAMMLLEKIRVSMMM